ncbi:MAG: hypothetical protein HZY79_05050 [Rhodoblastus sp.]|nr:MAG: hypothetical protein HZY79_05050 [Rhodoblastus sp.]
MIALYATPDAPPEAALARAVVTQAQALEARYALAPAGCDPLRSPCAGEASTEKTGRKTGQKTGEQADKPKRGGRLRPPAASGGGRRLAPRPAPPRAGCRGARFRRRRPRRARRRRRRAAGGARRANAGRPGLVAWLTPQGLRLAPAGAEASALDAGPLVTSETFADPARAAAALERALSRARQALTLRRLAQAGLGAGALAVTAQARRHGLDASGKCAFKTPGAPIEEGAPLEVCDRLTLTLENRGEEAVLPAVFFLDDGWNLIARRPACPVGLSVADRLEPGKRLSVEIPYHARAISPGFAPAAANGALVIGAPFRPGEAELPNLCGLAAFNDAAAGAARGEGDDLDALLSGATRGGPRLALEASALSLSFWQVRQPTR